MEKKITLRLTSWGDNKKEATQAVFSSPLWSSPSFVSLKYVIVISQNP